MDNLKNPFDLVKATDLSDNQIADWFVDFPSGASLIDRVKPTSQMPMFILGGKGSGKTHLMRFLSYSLQLRRHGRGTSARAGIERDGYLGIYFRCSGLNAERFAGKGQSEEVWKSVFSYYMELWFGQLVLATILDLYHDSPSIRSSRLIDEAVRLLDVLPSPIPTSLEDLAHHLEALQRQADVSINNCALTRELKIQVQATPGRLVFGLPQAIANHLPEFRSALFLYLIDEFENLTEPQQQYINTLVRERQAPCSFRIGVRLYGFRTKKTLSAGEENREDSEYEALRLDAELRKRPHEAQRTFATKLIHRRLLQAGYLGGMTSECPDLSAWFEVGDQDPLLRTELAAVRDRYSDREPPYVTELQRKLKQGLTTGSAHGLRTDTDIQYVITALRLPEFPFVERTSIFLLYRAWAHSENLWETAESLSRSAREYASGSETTPHHDVLRYFRSDIEAQLLRETKQPLRYLGLDSFIRMAAGLPRSLLTILKYIFKWSLFFGEEPFRQGLISIRAQNEGVSQASEWFFTEARAPGYIGIMVRDAMTRLGQLLREIRFSDKPAECSLSTFSADLTTANQEAIEVLEEADNWTMLLRIPGGQHDRNEGRVDEKYQVHPMLAPRWDLPIARRGALELSGEELNAIFAPSESPKFQNIARRRVAAMTAPYFGKPPRSSTPRLPGLTDE